MLNAYDANLMCEQCNRLLCKPVYLPCFCTVCHIHLLEATAHSRGIITCETCHDSFDVLQIRVKENTHAKYMLDAKQQAITELNAHEHLYEQFDAVIDQTKKLCQEKFAAIRHQISLQRDTLKKNMGKLVSDIMAKANGAENIFVRALERYTMRYLESKRFHDEYLYFNASSLSIQQLNEYSTWQVNEMRAKINALTEFQEQIASVEFRPSDCQELELGNLCFENGLTFIRPTVYIF